MTAPACMISVFIREPEFQGQTKDRLATAEATAWSRRDPRSVRPLARGNPMQANKLVDFVVERSEERIRAAEKEISRKTAVRKLRLPGKLADCTNTAAQARKSSSSRVTAPAAGQAGARTRLAGDFALRGKILNVASAGKESSRRTSSSPISSSARLRLRRALPRRGLRYEKVIVMTDADVDGAISPRSDHLLLRQMRS